MDLFDFRGKVYILVVDYYSRWVDMRLPTSQTSEAVINVLKSIFSTHGIPDIVMSDSCLRFSADLFYQFAEENGFVHVTSSPHYPQANG